MLLAGRASAEVEVVLAAVAVVAEVEDLVARGDQEGDHAVALVDGQVSLGRPATPRRRRQQRHQHSHWASGRGGGLDLVVLLEALQSVQRRTPRPSRIGTITMCMWSTSPARELASRPVSKPSIARR